MTKNSNTVGVIFKKYNRLGKNKGLLTNKDRVFDEPFLLLTAQPVYGLHQQINQTKQNKNVSTETYIMEFIIHMTLFYLRIAARISKK